MIKTIPKKKKCKKAKWLSEESLQIPEERAVLHLKLFHCFEALKISISISDFNGAGTVLRTLY